MRPEFAKGARNAVRVCVNVGPKDRVCIIRDRPRMEIAQAIEEEVAGTGADVRAWTMEDVLTRPATSFPRAFADEIRKFKPTVSYFIGTGLKGELAFRQPMRDLLVQDLRCRHGHMIGIDAAVMADGMAGDYDEIYRVTRRVYEVVRSASKISVRTALGTEIEARFTPSLKWIPCDGRYWEQGSWGNLPEGETFTCPQSVDGVVAAEEIGDWFADKYGKLPAPVRIVIKDGRAAAVETADPVLSSELREYLSQDVNSDRVGEFAIGTNVGLSRIVGNFLQDEKFPGVHMAFGDPYGHETGADWRCPSHVDVLASHATIAVDGRTIMEEGRFLI